MRRLLLAAIAVLALAPAAQADPPRPDVRFATFNASLNRSNPGQLVDRPFDAEVDNVFRRQARNVAEIIQRNRPDVLLINEFDYAPAARSTSSATTTSRCRQNGAAPIDYPYASSRRPTPASRPGMDFKNDGVDRGPNDAFGFGFFPGQFGMVVYSKYPIHTTRSGPSSSSSGRTCPALCCRTIRRRRLRPTGTPRPSWTSSGSRRRATGTSRST